MHDHFAKLWGRLKNRFSLVDLLGQHDNKLIGGRSCLIDSLGKLDVGSVWRLIGRHMNAAAFALLHRACSTTLTLPVTGPGYAL